jgi:ABC-type antimicrobial peptide transport system permease subunit
MSLFRIALRSILQRGIASLLTTFSMALGVMLVVAVLSIHGVVSQSFRNNASLGYNMIVGAKGGQEQLTLNTVFYLSKPVENIPYTYYLEFLKRGDRARLQAHSFAVECQQELLESAAVLNATNGDGIPSLASEDALRRLGQALVPDTRVKPHHPPVETGRDGKYGLMTDLAIPLCLGDFFGRFRVVGTTPAMFDDFVWDIENNRKFEFAQGRNFRADDSEHGYFEAVVGSTVAREITLTELQLKIDSDRDVAASLLADNVNWTRIERKNDLIVLTLGQGGAESDVFLALKRLRRDVEQEKRTLTDAENKALSALLDPSIVVKRLARHIAIGDAISPRHGDPEGHVHEQKFTVVGILQASGTPNDRAVFVNMEGFYLMADHANPLDKPKTESSAGQVIDQKTWEEMKKSRVAEREKRETTSQSPHEPLPVEQREVTALLLKVPYQFSPGLENAINEGAQAQAVLPVAVIFGLFEFIVNPIEWTLLVLTAMICVVSAISILVSIYNSMSERRGEIAVMRALGAGRGTVMTIILLEATLLALGGGILGWLGGHAMCLIAGPWIEQQTGVSVGFLNLLTLPLESILIPSLMILAIAVGIWPAISAYRTDVAKSLGK